MSKTVTYEQLKNALSEFGFKPEQEGAAHVIFRHSKTGVVVTVPKMGKTVRPVFVSTAARQIANSGIATAKTFENRLEKAAESVD
jgi:predicted RNA binding protein YcfA (HicA-like mRNA interferase family)